MAGGRRPTDSADLPASGQISQEPRPVTGPRAVRTPAPDPLPPFCCREWLSSSVAQIPRSSTPVTSVHSRVWGRCLRSEEPRSRAVSAAEEAGRASHAQSRGREKGAQTPGGGRDVGAAFVSFSSQRCRASFSPAQVSRLGHRSVPATWTVPGSWGAAGRGRPRPGGAQFDQRHSVSRKKE